MAPNPTTLPRLPLSLKEEVNNAPKLTLTSHSTSEGDGYTFDLSDELAKLAKEELNETEETRREGLAVMRHFLAQRPHLSSPALRANAHDAHNPLFSAKFLLRFLRAQKFNVEKSCQVLEGYLHMRTENPEWFLGLDPTQERLTELVDSGFLLVLPERDPEGRRVIVSCASKIDVSRFDNSDVMRLFVSVLETLMRDEENQIRGFTYIFLCEGLSLNHLSIWCPSDAVKLFGTCEKNISIRHRDINLVGLPLCLWAVLEFVKNLLSSKIRSRIHCVGDVQKVVKKLGGRILPRELGGSSSQSLKEMIALWKEEWQANKVNLTAMDEFVVDKEGKKVEEETKENDESATKGSGSYWNYFLGRR